MPAGLTKDQFRRRFRAGLLAAWLIPPATGELGMTFLGFWELREAGLSLVRFTGAYVLVSTLIAFFVFERLVVGPVVAFGDRQHASDPGPTKRLKAFPWVFWGLLGLYTSCGPATVLLSNAVFQGTEYTFGQYAFSAFGVIPFLLIAAFPLFFYLTDLLGRFLAPRGLIVMVAPLWLKLVVLGLFTPVMIDTILLTYYENRTGFLAAETIMLWFALILMAGAGTLVALRSLHRGMRALGRPLGATREAGAHAYPVPRSLDEFGLLARGWADLFAANEDAERSLRQSEARLSGIIQVANDAIITIDQSQQIILFNHGAERVFGYARDEAVGRPLDMLLPERFRGRHRVSVERFAREDVAARPMSARFAPLFGCRKNGEEFPLDASISKLDLGGEKLLTVALRDITERKRVEEALHESQIRHDEAQRLAHLGHWALDLVKNELVWSDEVYRIFQRDPQEFGASYEAFLNSVHPDDRPIVDQAYTDSVANKTPYDIVHRLRMEDGTIKHVNERCETHYDDEGKPLRSIGTVQDITVQRLAEEELRTHREHLEELVATRTAELAAANEKMKELDQLKSMFIASMSHELRTPLNSIIGFTGIILQGMVGDLNPTQKDQLSRVYRASKHLLELISDVIDISKIEAGKIEAFPTEFALDELIREAAEDVEPQLTERGLKLAVSMPQRVLMQTDRMRLLQCLLNYLSNAVKFTEAGDIRISVHDLGSSIEVEVTDSGIGVAKEDASKLFQPFVRLDSSLRPKTSGTGLGLYLTRKLVTEVLGGSVKVRSEPGKGSTFSLEVPKKIAKEEPVVREDVFDENGAGN